MAKTKAFNGLTQDQAKYLNDALKQTRYHHRRKDPPMPRALRAARRALNKWDKMQRRESDKFDRRVHKA